MGNDELDIKLSSFLAKISSWANSNDIVYNADNKFINIDDVRNVLDADPKQFREITSEQCQERLYLLNQYLFKLNSVVATEKNIKLWAEQGISYLVAGYEFNNYMKWEEKKFLIVRRSRIAEKLQELKTVSDSRIATTEPMVKRVESSIKIIENIARIKSYERS